jgi:hypothetical protein
MINYNYLLEKAKAKGSELDYIDWLHKWPSCLSGTYSEWHNGQGFCEAAHVRHVSRGAGTGTKPEYWAVPLTGDEHKLAHQKGDAIFYPPEWWDEQAAHYLCIWTNGVKPPKSGEEKRHWKKEYTIHSAGHVLAIWLMLKKFFTAKPDGAVKITIQRAVKRRSTKQNGAQWGVIYGHVLEFYQSNPHAFLRDGLAWLQLAMDRKQISSDFIHELCKGLHNEGMSTARLSSMESSEYFKEIRAHLYDRYGYEFPEIISPDGGADGI